MPRKTFDVETVKKQCNLMLGLKGPEYTPEYRRAVIGIVERILLDSRTYKGFQYRYSEWDVERRQLKAGYDQTRRTYF